MKVLLVFTMFMSSAACFATTKEAALNAFSKNSDVRALIMAYRRVGRVDVKPDVAFLSQSCGYAGCVANYLVTLAAENNSVQNETSSIAAMVSVSDYESSKVKVVQVQDLIKLAR